jgi:hypothetical protein
MPENNPYSAKICRLGDVQKLVQAAQLKEEGLEKRLLQPIAYGIVKGVKNEA